jgi:GNAT superfamily N-acetyltransferase
MKAARRPAPDRPGRRAAGGAAASIFWRSEVRPPAAAGAHERDRLIRRRRAMTSPHGTDIPPAVQPPRAAGRVPLFCDTALAARIERVEAQLIARCSEAARHRSGTAGFVIPLAGGVASFAGDGSPYNKVAGLGFGGVPGAAALDEIERAFAAAGAPAQVELAHLADPEIAARLTARGYQLESFENVLGQALPGGAGRVAPAGIEVRRSGAAEFEAWLGVVAEGSVHPDPQGVPWHEEFPREMIIDAERASAEAGTVRYAALRDGALAGGASMRLAEGVAQLTGAATAPAHRRRGIQTALLAARLADATAAGCDIAVIVTQPGSKSQQNAQRQGFDLLYTRAVLARHPEAPSPAAAG